MTFKTLKVEPECYGSMKVSFEGELLTKQEIPVDGVGKNVYEFYKTAEGVILSVIRYVSHGREIASYSAYAPMDIEHITRSLNNCEAIDGTLPGVVKQDLQNYL